MKYKWSLFLALLSLLFVPGTVLAKGLQSSPASLNNVHLQTTHCGTIINVDDIWSGNGTVHIITCDVIVPSGVTLTIQPGAILKFNYPYALRVQGTLRVLGTAAKPVYLTSIKDDVGGDTNGDGSATTPTSGDWSRVEFEDSSDDPDPDSLIDYAVIRYAGCCSTDSAGIKLLGASPTIQNTTLAWNQHYAILADLTSKPTLANNIYSHNDINGLALHGTTISTDTTWDITSTAYFITDDITVEDGATLTINLGVVVKFNEYELLKVQGALNVLGTPGSPVYFTSAKDDALKGDTNNDGATTPAPGDWSHIQFEDSTDDPDPNSLIDYAIIRYGGCCTSFNGGINLVGVVSPTIQHTTLAFNQFSAIQADPSSAPILTNNTYSQNGINGLAIQGDLTSGTATWNITSTAYFISRNITVKSPATLIINQGVVVKFGSGKALLVQGTLNVQGKAASPVYFTSARDDAVKGDTNNDGASTAPAPGNWSGIEFQAGSRGLIQHAIIRYGGGGGGNPHGGITILGASPTIRDTTITKNHNYGIYAAGNSAPALGCNNISLNDSYGLFTTTSINALNQWWGSASGPYHTTNPSGKENNKVSDGVTFIPVSEFPCYSLSPLLSKSTFLSQKANDGWVLELSQNSDKGSALNATTNILALGDNGKQRQYLSILSFNTAGLPDDAIITGVTLRVRKNGIVGVGDPVKIFQGFMLDIKNGPFGSPALQIDDFQATASKTYGPFKSYLVGNSKWYTITIDLTGEKAYINKSTANSGLTQIRLRFKLDDNNNAFDNILKLFSGNAPTAAYRPQLIITYYPVTP